MLCRHSLFLLSEASAMYKMHIYMEYIVQISASISSLDCLAILCTHVPQTVSMHLSPNPFCIVCHWGEGFLTLNKS